MTQVSFHTTLSAALRESARRRSFPDSAEMIVRVEPSPYGGYRVSAMPADFYVDQLADGLLPARRMPKRMPHTA